MPWGHIAAKWWGPQHIRPIVLLHGWQDNCATFDALIPLLPRHVSYLAIDLPGHGKSSHLPIGMFYSHVFFIYVIRLIHKKFNWEKISLCSHSMGGILSFIYASIFPSECDMVVNLDSLKPPETSENNFLRFYTKAINKNWISDVKEPPSYSYEKIIDKLMHGTFSSYTLESLQYLLVRGIKESILEPTKYYFTRDNRLKSLFVLIVDIEVNLEMAGRIKAPFCFIKALQCQFSLKWRYMDEILQTMKENNPKFEVHGVDGDHHVHLAEPEKVSRIISRFIENYRPGSILSKL